MDTDHPSGIWELHILKHLIDCCIIGASGPVGDSDAEESESESNFVPNENEQDQEANLSKAKQSKMKQGKQSSSKLP
jgi:hypothetical protein